MEIKKVVIAGATGAIGKRLYESLLRQNYEVYVVSRDPKRASELLPGATGFVEFDVSKPFELRDFIDGARAVINLAGAPIFTRWRGDYEKEIIDSRIKGTRYIVDAIEKCEKRPEVLINGSAAGIYGYSGEVAADENSPAGNDFWAKLVTDWENEANSAKTLGVRVVTVRTTLVLEEGIGALETLVPYFEKGLGGYARPGTQVFPWVHMEDEVGIIMKAIENNNFSGPINCVGGNTTSRIFSESVGKAMNKKSGIPIPGFIIKTLFGRASDLVLKSQTIKSERLGDLGYELKYKDINLTMESLLNSED